MQIHHPQHTQGAVFDQSPSRTSRTGQPVSAIAASVAGKTALQRARLAIIAHIFALLPFFYLDSPTSAVSVIVSALKVATSICQHRVDSDRDEGRSHHD
jgi:hypothetical protein